MTRWHDQPAAWTAFATSSESSRLDTGASRSSGYKPAHELHRTTKSLLLRVAPDIADTFAELAEEDGDDEGRDVQRVGDAGARSSCS